MGDDTTISIVLPKFTDNQVKMAKLGFGALALVVIYKAKILR